MNIIFMALLGLALFATKILAAEGEITPHKFDDSGPVAGYKIPTSSRFSTSRLKEDDVPDIVYYLSKPQQEFIDLGAGVLTVEQWGVDGDDINPDEFMEHYTLTQRLLDHRMVIENLKKNPPVGWNGKIILFGASEGGPLVTTLTIDFPESVIATINWSGAGDWSRREELWVFVEKLLLDDPDCPEHKLKLKDCPCMEDAATRERFDAKMDETLKDQTASKEFLGMTYQYYADVQEFPKYDYAKIKAPFLLVSGTNDSLIKSSDAFVKKATEAGAKITYFRVNGMDHYVRKRPDIVAKTFDWLKEQLEPVEKLPKALECQPGDILEFKE